MHYRHVIWDWNGTIVNDVELAVELTNVLLSKTGTRGISIDEHRSFFEIPIINYYRAIGLSSTPEMFVELDEQFHQIYDTSKHRLQPFTDVGSMLSWLVSHGCHSSILSALPHQLLTEHLSHLELSSHFKYVVGRNTVHAESKVTAGNKLIEELKLKGEEVLIIGDTIYDHEVANALGADCALIARGHQDIARLQAVNPTFFVHSLEELRDLLEKALEEVE